MPTTNAFHHLLTTKLFNHPVEGPIREKNNPDSLKLFYIIFSCCTLLHLAVALLSRLYPHWDLPFHLAAATIYKYYGSPGNDFSQYFYFDVFLKPNTFHIFFTSLPVFPSVEIGNKVIYAGYLLLFPVSVMLLIRQIGGNQWYSLFSFLLIYNYNLNWGFVGFNIAIPLVLLLVYFIFKSLQTNSVWDKIAVAVLLVVIYFMHALVTVFSLMVFGAIYGFYYRRSLKKLAVALLMALPTLALVVYWWSTSQSDADTVGFLIKYYRTEYLPEFVTRLKIISMENYFLFGGVWGYLAGAFFTILMHLPLGIWVFNHFKKIPEYLDWQKLGGLYLFILVSLGVYFLAPSGLDDYFFLNQRFSIFVHIGFILLGSVLVGKQHLNKVIALASIAFILHFGAYTQRQIAFEKNTAEFTPDFLIPDVKGKKFGGIMLEESFRGRRLYHHFPNYQIVWHQGVTTTQSVDFRFGSIRRKVGKEILPGYFDTFPSFTGKALNPYSGLVDYILIRGKIDERGRTGEMRAYNLIKSKGNWSIWEKK